jgi:hypothetical protein
LGILTVLTIQLTGDPLASEDNKHPPNHRAAQVMRFEHQAGHQSPRQQRVVSLAGQWVQGLVNGPGI